MTDDTPAPRPRNGISHEVLKRFDDLDSRLLPFMVDVQTKLAALEKTTTRTEGSLERQDERLDHFSEAVIRLEGRVEHLESRPPPFLSHENYASILARLDSSDTERRSLQASLADPDPKHYLTHDEIVVLRQKMDWWKRYRTELLTLLGVIGSVGFFLVTLYFNIVRHLPAP